ncbi:MAG: hypothetical protein HOE48_15095 [Candidatus Latescibacteria bacterium]|jgi:hypothetical protein|nr:hypothetical protein [Candidatus Latescibacterota bacterium]MBT4139245.1 hypothetical protein [Candidatus Latescibacterota bacterium]MBT5831169.1 hypothetical protein [Candidatus Latescibacterota bacterium]
MKLPPTTTIPIRKLTHYLLVPREHDDKSKFLALADFTLQNPNALLIAIRRLIATQDAIEDCANDYGVFFHVDGDLMSPTNKLLSVRTIWIRRKIDGLFHFVTLIPLR